MKQYIQLMVAAVLLAACNNSGSKQFTISGNLKGAPATTVYLEQISYNNMPPQVIDSATLQNGGFALKGTAEEESLLQLRFPAVPNGPVFFVVNDESSIQLAGDWNDQRSIRFSKSAASQRLHNFVDSLSVTQQKIYQDKLQADNLPVEADSLRRSLQQKMDQTLQAFRSFIRTTAETDKSPIVSMFATSLYGGDTPDENEALFNTLQKRFPKHAGIQAVVKQFRESVAAAAGPQQQAAKPGVGSDAPDITMPDVNGKSFSLSSLRGKYVLVDFWAAWCGPCRMENPNVVAAYKKFSSRNFTVLGVSLDKTKEDWLEAIKADQLDWYHISDLKFWESAAVGLYGFDGIPYNVLVDPQGKIIAVGLRGPALEQKLNEVLQ